MLASDIQADDPARRRHVGLSGYALKPVRRAELHRLICQALEMPVSLNANDAGRQYRAQPAEIKLANAMKILVADDSADNCELIEIYLKGTPHLVRFAQDGKSALEEFAREPFDLVLMDIQMPVMDGLTATRAMRSFERERSVPSTPILALSANARHEDIEMSRMAGCNAHLSKPISKKELLKVVEEYGKPMHAAVRSGEGADTIQIEMPEGLEQRVPVYLASRKSELLILAECLAQSDFEKIQVLAHNMKGTGASYGFENLTKLGGAIEDSAKEGNATALERDLAALEHYLSRVQLRVSS